MKHLKFKKPLSYFLFLIMIVGMFSGCSLDTKKVKTKEVTNSDKSIKISVPETWKENKKLNEKAEIGVANLKEEKYIIVIKEPKEQFTKGMSIDDYYKAFIENIKTVVKDSSVTARKDIKIDKYKVKPFEIKGEVEKIKVTYLASIIETEKNFYMVTTWTLQNKYDQNKEDLKNALQSFKELK